MRASNIFVSTMTVALVAAGVFRPSWQRAVEAQQAPKQLQLFLRREAKTDEYRAIIDPKTAQRLNENPRVKVTVESSPLRCFKDKEYEDVGVQVTSVPWQQASTDAVIVGFKGLPETEILTHTHLTTVHPYYSPFAASGILSALKRGNGHLLGIDYMKNPDTDAAFKLFGRPSGYVAAGLAMLAWSAHVQSAPMPTNLFFDYSEAVLLAAVRAEVRPVRVLVIGGRGDAGVGAQELLNALGPQVTVTSWGHAQMVSEQADDRSLAQQILTDFDVLINTANVGDKNDPAFLTINDVRALRAKRRLAIVADVGAGYYAAGTGTEPLPILNDVRTTLDKPVTTVQVDNDEPLLVIRISNLPSLVARDASEEYAAMLYNVYLRLANDYQGAGILSDQYFKNVEDLSMKRLELEAEG